MTVKELRDWLTDKPDDMAVDFLHAPEDHPIRDACSIGSVMTYAISDKTEGIVLIPD